MKSEFHGMKIQSILNASNPSTRIEDEESDTLFCIAGGNLVCPGVGEPRAEEQKRRKKPVAGKPMHTVESDQCMLWRNSNEKSS